MRSFFVDKLSFDFHLSAYGFIEPMPGQEMSNDCDGVGGESVLAYLV
jgi:hypothetical protein